MILLGSGDLALAALLVIASAGLAWALRLGISASLLIAGARMVVQLLLVGLVLKAVFEQVALAWVALIAIVMLLVAGYEATARQERPMAGLWSMGIGVTAMFLSTFSVTVLALAVVLGPTPWYTPQYAIPLLGMMLGNTMNGVALSLERLTQSLWDRRAVVEARLMLGHTWRQAVADIRRECMRAGMIPTLNAMAAAGIVSLPGMMTGQILAGTPPVEAVKYQILIMCLIMGATSVGTALAVQVACRRLFDGRERLRLDRLKAP
jgi:UDP-glucose/iron transport system permease protein